MFYCPRCRYKRDTVNFPKFFAGLIGRVCKRCLAEVERYPDDHNEARRWRNAGFQEEKVSATTARMLLMERDKLVHGN